MTTENGQPCSLIKIDLNDNITDIFVNIYHNSQTVMKHKSDVMISVLSSHESVKCMKNITTYNSTICNMPVSYHNIHSPDTI